MDSRTFPGAVAFRAAIAKDQAGPGISKMETPALHRPCNFIMVVPRHRAFSQEMTLE
jgi:hypothetical protein